MATKYFPPCFEGFQIFPRVYSLVPVCRERLLTLRHQQQRACNLAEWLADRHAPGRVAVVGGGLAGLTFIAAFRRLQPSASLTLVERQSELLANLRSCESRWLHPHFFSWPDSGWTMRRTVLPVLNWEAGDGRQVYDTIIEAWKREGIPAETRTRVVRIDSSTRGIDLTTQSVDTGAEQTRAFDALVLALGPGLERLHSGNDTGSYWEPDTLGVSAKYEPSSTFVVAGGGDGALTDLLRLRVRSFVQHASIETLGHAIRLQEVFDKLNDGERPTASDGEAIRHVLDLRKETRVTLVTDDDGRDFPNAFKINRLLARCLRAIDGFEHRRGRAVGSAEWTQKERVEEAHRRNRIVVLEEGAPVMADYFIARVGITPPVLVTDPPTRLLSEVEEAILAEQKGSWARPDEAKQRESAERAKPGFYRLKSLNATAGKVAAEWLGPSTVAIGGVTVAFEPAALRINGETLDSALLESAVDAVSVGVVPRLGPPQGPSAFRFAALFATGARLFVVGQIAGGVATLTEWEQMGCSFQIVELAADVEAFRAEQPHIVGTPFGGELSI